MPEYLPFLRARPRAQPFRSVSRAGPLLRAASKFCACFRKSATRVALFRQFASSIAWLRAGFLGGIIGRDGQRVTSTAHRDCCAWPHTTQDGSRNLARTCVEKNLVKTARNSAAAQPEAAHASPRPCRTCSQPRRSRPVQWRRLQLRPALCGTPNVWCHCSGVVPL